MSKKQIATTFLKMAARGDVKAAYDQFVAPEFIHHNQYFKGDRRSLMEAMQEAHLKSPNKAIDTLHVYEDGNTVITHSRVTRMNSDQPGIAVVHIFRIQGNQIVELWDLGQEIMRDSPNENGPF
jgi:predicted SnoaL-like aldol condensation-catalyzing enzyme